jgi:hypothetical protein
MSRQYRFVAARAGHRCEYCRAPEVVFNLRFEVEHIVPVSKSGSDEDSNLALSCRGCNLFKSDAETAFDPVTAEFVAMYHPRQLVWQEHFAFVPESCAVEGTTAVGRAMVAQLQMNNPMQLASRRWWMTLGLYP